MLKSFSVKDLHNRSECSYNLEFYPDLNIFTGKNGSGKTTLLKLIWYMISPNLERIIPEINFRCATVETDKFRISIDRCANKKTAIYSFSYVGTDNKELRIEFPKEECSSRLSAEKIEQINRKIILLQSSSVFFPTFRRIEGGFSLNERGYGQLGEHVAGNLLEALSIYTDRISVRNHRFIVSISTDDIEQLLTRQYADVSEKTNELHLELSQFISDKIHPQDRSVSKAKQAVNVADFMRAMELLEAIRKKVTEVDSKRSRLMSRFDVLRDLITAIFKDKGITVAQNLTFGEAKTAIRASILSAGEKQMLSFLCYNAFTENCPIFIDEPELSLHGDWQRILFSTLLSQGTSNQFIVSTHSPFIYSKYPEREIYLNKDRGE